MCQIVKYILLGLPIVQCGLKEKKINFSLGLVEFAMIKLVEFGLINMVEFGLIKMVEFGLIKMVEFAPMKILSEKSCADFPQARIGECR